MPKHFDEEAYDTDAIFLFALGCLYTIILIILALVLP